MSSTSNAAQRLRLKQVPIDVWSAREKLALASSVARSGDQNWYSVSRPLKAFGEANRPPDWFSQKNCALQYSDMLEKVETPKRKRGERGEDTAQQSIVRKLTVERMEELKKLIATEKEKSQRLKEEIELVKSGKATPAMLRDIWKRMKEEEKQKEIEEEEHIKWLQEREAKIAELKVSRANLIGFAIKPKPATSASPANVGSPTKTENKPDIPSSDAQMSEPLTIEVEESTNPVSAVEGVKESKLDEKSANIPICPSTSPLLTSLLQSPSNSSVSSSIFSPISHVNKETPSQTKLTLSTTSMVTSTTITPCVTTLNVSQTTITEKSIPTVTITTVDDSSSQQTSIQQSDRIVEMPTKVKEDEGIKGESLVKSEDCSEKQNMEVTIIPIVIDTSNKDVIQDEKESSVEQTDDSVNGETSMEITKLEEPEKPSTTEIDIDELQEIKQEAVEVKEEDSAFEEVTVKQEIEETDDSSTALSELKTPGITPISARTKRRKPAVTPTSTPILTPTRRSGRVKANRELKLSEGDDRESTPNPETGAKKFTNPDETTDASMSEESLDAAIKQNTSKAPSITESTPNSPASSTMHSEDAENLREYKQWKKSIMLLWRQAATHKFASLFLHPVTDDEAKGYSTVVYRPQDLTTIRKRIENGSLRTTAEFQRDIMLMFQNAIMYNSADHEVHQMAVEMQKEILEGIEDFIETQQQGSQSIEISKSRVRRSAISTPVNETHEQDNSIAFRRKSRTSTDTDPGSSSGSTVKGKTKKKP